MKAPATSESTAPSETPPQDASAATPPAPPTSSSTPSPTSPAATPPAAPGAPVQAQWHNWVRPVDAFLLLLVVVTAFLGASFVARNSDQWLHYAAGRALLTGQAGFGSDPFTYTERTWVNHAWLYDIASYLILQAEPSGAAIVALKALAFAAAFVVVIGLRQPGQALWPWVLAALIGVLAAVQHAQLRPMIGSALWLALTVWIVLGRSWAAGSAFVNRVALAVIGWLWASTDTWFVLGPVVLLLVWLGETLQAKLFGGSSVPRQELLKALGVMVVACSLTPHHVRVWQVPLELGVGLPANYSSDRELSQLIISPTNLQFYANNPFLGKNLNGAAFALLLLGGGLVLAVGSRELRVSELMLWIAFAALALVHYRLILFFAIVGVPILATNLAAITGRIHLGTVGDARSSALLLFSSVSRIIALPALLAVVAATYPGWLTPQSRDPAWVLRLGWGVLPDAGYQRAAELLQRWHADGRLPDTYRGVSTNWDLANHLAWFAPNVKTFVNGRFQFHAPELEALLPARKLVAPRETPIEPREIDELGELLKTHQLNYLMYASGGTPPQNLSLLPLLQLTERFDRYALWHVDGRVAILGDLKAAQYDATTYAALAFDPVRLAFQPADLIPLEPPAELTAPRKLDGEFLEPFFLDPPKPRPIEALDAQVWHALSKLTQDADQRYRFQAWPVVAAAVGNPVVASQAQRGGYQPSDVMVAYELLAARSAMRAIILAPDDPDAYRVVAGALGQDSNLLGLQDKSIATIAGLRRYLDRVTDLYLSTRGVAHQMFPLHLQLADLYQQQLNSPELAAQTLTEAKRYMAAAMPDIDAKEFESRLKSFTEGISQLEKQAAQANDQLERAIATGQGTPAQVVAAAHALGLLGRALDQYHQLRQKNELGNDAAMLTLIAADASFRMGRIEQADQYLREASAALEELAKAQQPLPPELRALQIDPQQLRVGIWMYSGNYAAVGKVMEQAQFPPFTANQLAYLKVALESPNAEEWDRNRSRYFNVASAVVGMPAAFYLQANANITLNQYQQQAGFFLQRAVLLLLEGKNIEAETRFRQALAPQGLPLPSFMPERIVAERYLRLFAQAKSPMPPAKP